ncbi:Nonsense-mediated mRNA decay protein 5 [Dispira parvispora]|uniref:Nonsense-mediated mRNA decay protein 5 n=1 Tax=Dispira parvispora TaxID=1520584 RepID=A0A9W8AZN1_9FUNG|nr:Nonsense-mediated mRNA decay protein 5 [Dispira parvispora]
MMPVKVLRRVCRYLAHRPADLLHFALVSQEFRWVALEYLWRRPRFSTPEGFHSFLTTVQRKRHLTTGVRSLCLVAVSPHTQYLTDPSGAVTTELDSTHLFTPVVRSQQPLHKQLSDSILSDPKFIIPLLRLCENVQELIVYGWRLRDTDLSAIAALCPRLRRWEIVGGGPYSVNHFGLLVRQLPCLTQLALDSSHDLTQDLAVLCAPRRKPLTHLQLGGSTITTAMVDAVFQSHPKLITLSLPPLRNFTNSQLQHWVDLYPALRSLTLYDSDVGIATVGLITERCPQLIHLDIRRGTQFGADKTTVEWMVPACDSLRALVLENIGFTDDTALMVANSCKQLETVGFCACPTFTDEGVSHILDNVHSLKGLTCIGCPKVTDSTLTLLAEHQPMSLEVLVLESCGIDSAVSIEHFLNAASSLTFCAIKGEEVVKQKFEYCYHPKGTANGMSSPGQTTERSFIPEYDIGHPLHDMSTVRTGMPACEMLPDPSEKPATHSWKSYLKQLPPSNWVKKCNPPHTSTPGERSAHLVPKQAGVNRTACPPTKVAINPYGVPPNPAGADDISMTGSLLAPTPCTINEKLPDMLSSPALVKTASHPLPLGSTQPGYTGVATASAQILPFSSRTLKPSHYTPVAVDRPPISRVPSNFSQTSQPNPSLMNGLQSYTSPALSVSQVSMSAERRPMAPAPKMLIRWEEWGDPEVVQRVAKPSATPAEDQTTDPNSISMRIRNLAKMKRPDSAVGIPSVVNEKPSKSAENSGTGVIMTSTSSSAATPPTESESKRNSELTTRDLEVSDVSPKPEIAAVGDTNAVTMSQSPTAPLKPKPEGTPKSAGKERARFAPDVNSSPPVSDGGTPAKALPRKQADMTSTSETPKQGRKGEDTNDAVVMKRRKSLKRPNETTTVVGKVINDNASARAEECEERTRKKPTKDVKKSLEGGQQRTEKIVGQATSLPPKPKADETEEFVYSPFREEQEAKQSAVSPVKTPQREIVIRETSKTPSNAMTPTKNADPTPKKSRSRNRRKNREEKNKGSSAKNNHGNGSTAQTTPSRENRVPNGTGSPLPLNGIATPSGKQGSHALERAKADECRVSSAFSFTSPKPADTLATSLPTPPKGPVVNSQATQETPAPSKSAVQENTTAKPEPKTKKEGDTSRKPVVPTAIQDEPTKEEVQKTNPAAPLSLAEPSTPSNKSPSLADPNTPSSKSPSNGDATRPRRNNRAVLPGRGKVVLELNIETKAGTRDTLTVCELDDSHQIAREFCLRHHMQELEDGLVRLIIDGKNKKRMKRAKAGASQRSATTSQSGSQTTSPYKSPRPATNNATLSPSTRQVVDSGIRDK